MEQKYAFVVSVLLVMFFSRTCMSEDMINPQCKDKTRTTGWCSGAEYCVIRYYFSLNANRCKPFAFHSQKDPGSRNFFESKNKCNEKCPPVDPALLTTTTPPTIEPTQATEMPVMPPTTTPPKPTPPKTTPTEDSRDRCFMPREVGQCSDFTTRWYYSVKTFACEPFQYSGCGGNANNFESFKACAFTCPKRDRCGDYVDVVPCKERTYHWYYNVTALECQQYRVQDCALSDNRFMTKRECQNACNGCKLPPYSGECRGFFPKLFYNSTTKMCERFIYGGCFGNMNQFETEKECLRDCA